MKPEVQPRPDPEPPTGRAPRRVTFSADDFGLAPSLNRAVALAHRCGLLGNASLMPGAPAASEALALTKNSPGLCLGVHLTLIQGRAVLPPRALPRLVDSEGRFPSHPVHTGWRYFFDTGLLPDIRRELGAQIEAVLTAGVRVWHINGHLNLHLHPRLLPLVVDLAREYRIPALRSAAEDWRATLALAPDRPLAKAALGCIFGVLSRRARRLAREAGLFMNDHLFGLTHPGRVTEAYVLGLVPRLKPGLTEIYSHPALGPEAWLEKAAPGYLRQQEFQALTSPRVREALGRQGIEVTTFREAVRKRTRTPGHFSP